MAKGKIKLHDVAARVKAILEASDKKWVTFDHVYDELGFTLNLKDLNVVIDSLGLKWSTVYVWHEGMHHMLEQYKKPGKPNVKHVEFGTSKPLSSYQGPCAYCIINEV